MSSLPSLYSSTVMFLPSVRPRALEHELRSLSHEPELTCPHLKLFSWVFWHCERKGRCLTPEISRETEENSGFKLSPCAVDMRVYQSSPSFCSGGKFCQSTSNFVPHLVWNGSSTLHHRQDEVTKFIDLRNTHGSWACES